MSEHDDKVFLQRFSLIIAGLTLFALAIILTSIYLHGQWVGSDNPAQERALEARLSPVFGVYSGETGRAATLAAAQPAAAETQVQLAFDGSLDGATIYNNVCQACHLAGAAGAPQLVAAQWETRRAQGVDTLVQHAINGIGVMPAKGGRADLSDAQVRASVEYMLDQLQ